MSAPAHLSAESPPALPQVPRANVLGLMAWGVLIALLASSWTGADMRPLDLLRDSGNMAEYASSFFPPNFNQWRYYLEEMVVTVQIALWGTALAVVCAVPLALLSSADIAPLWVRQPVRRLMDAARAKGAAVETRLGALEERATAEALVACAADRFGRLDAIVAAAGKADRGGALGLDRTRLAAATTNSAQAFLDLVQAGIELLKRGESPRIVAISSYVAHVFRDDLGLFAASAAGTACSARSMSPRESWRRVA